VGTWEAFDSITNNFIFNFRDGLEKIPLQVQIDGTVKMHLIEQAHPDVNRPKPEEKFK
jgi:hypothetical protein